MLLRTNRKDVEINAQQDRQMNQQPKNDDKQAAPPGPGADNKHEDNEQSLHKQVQEDPKNNAKVQLNQNPLNKKIEDDNLNHKQVKQKQEDAHKQNSETSDDVTNSSSNQLIDGSDEKLMETCRQKYFKQIQSEDGIYYDILDLAMLESLHQQLHYTQQFQIDQQIEYKSILSTLQNQNVLRQVHLKYKINDRSQILQISVVKEQVVKALLNLVDQYQCKIQEQFCVDQVLDQQYQCLDEARKLKISNKALSNQQIVDLIMRKQEYIDKSLIYISYMKQTIFQCINYQKLLQDIKIQAKQYEDTIIGTQNLDITRTSLVIQLEKDDQQSKRIFTNNEMINNFYKQLKNSQHYYSNDIKQEDTYKKYNIIMDPIQPEYDLSAVSNNEEILTAMIQQYCPDSILQIVTQNGGKELYIQYSQLPRQIKALILSCLPFQVQSMKSQFADSCKYYEKTGIYQLNSQFYKIMLQILEGFRQESDPNDEQYSQEQILTMIIMQTVIFNTNVGISETIYYAALSIMQIKVPKIGILSKINNQQVDLTWQQDTRCPILFTDEKYLHPYEVWELLGLQYAYYYKGFDEKIQQESNSYIANHWLFKKLQKQRLSNYIGILIDHLHAINKNLLNDEQFGIIITSIQTSSRRVELLQQQPTNLISTTSNVLNVEDEIQEAMQIPLNQLNQIIIMNDKLKQIQNLTKDVYIYSEQAEQLLSLQAQGIGEQGEIQIVGNMLTQPIQYDLIINNIYKYNFQYDRDQEIIKHNKGSQNINNMVTAMTYNIICRTMQYNKKSEIYNRGNDIAYNTYYLTTFQALLPQTLDKFYLQKKCVITQMKAVEKQQIDQDFINQYVSTTQIKQIQGWVASQFVLTYQIQNIDQTINYERQVYDTRLYFNPKIKQFWNNKYICYQYLLAAIQIQDQVLVIEIDIGRASAVSQTNGMISISYTSDDQNQLETNNGAIIAKSVLEIQVTAENFKRLCQYIDRNIKVRPTQININFAATQVQALQQLERIFQYQALQRQIYQLSFNTDLTSYAKDDYKIKYSNKQQTFSMKILKSCFTQCYSNNQFDLSLDQIQQDQFKDSPFLYDGRIQIKEGARQINDIVIFQCQCGYQCLTQEEIKIHQKEGHNSLGFPCKEKEYFCIALEGKISLRKVINSNGLVLSNITYCNKNPKPEQFIVNDANIMINQEDLLMRNNIAIGSLQQCYQNQQVQQLLSKQLETNDKQVIEEIQQHVHEMLNQYDNPQQQILQLQLILSQYRKQTQFTKVEGIPTITNKTRYKVADYIEDGRIKAAETLLINIKNKVESKILTQQQKEDILKNQNLFPEVQQPLIINHAQDKSPQQYVEFTQDEIKQAIKSIKRSSAAGISGLGPRFWKNQLQDQKSRDQIKQIFEQIINHPENVGLLPSLYQFDVTLLEKKKTKKFRPICVEESLLNIMHKALSRKLPRDVFVEQKVFLPDNILKCINLAKNQLSQGKVLILFDLKNAYNSIPWQLIIRGMEKAQIDPCIIAYITKFLSNRFSMQTGYVQCGVPQGDPLSTYLFCYGINEILQELGIYGLTFAYMDDIVVVFDTIEIAQKFLHNEAKQIFNKNGVPLNWDKTLIVQLDQLECAMYLGVNIAQFDKPEYSISKQLLDESKVLLDNVKWMKEQKISTWSILKIIQSSYVPKINYGPILDDIKDQKIIEYNDQIEQIILEMMATALEIDVKYATSQKFKWICTGAKEFGGFNIITPTAYKEFYDQFKQQVSELDSKSIWQSFKADLKTDIGHLQNIQQISACGLQSYTYPDKRITQQLIQNIKLFIQVDDDPGGGADPGGTEENFYCPVCQKQINDNMEHHEIECMALRSSYFMRHNAVQSVFCKYAKGQAMYCKGQTHQKMLQSQMKAGIDVQTAGNDDNNIKDQRIADVVYTINNEKHYVDFCICEESQIENRYKEKIQKHGNFYSNFEPIIISENCSIHKDSLVVMINAARGNSAFNMLCETAQTIAECNINKRDNYNEYKLKDEDEYIQYCTCSIKETHPCQTKFIDKDEAEKYDPTFKEDNGDKARASISNNSADEDSAEKI